ncbi:hypothetical protein AWC38_SpisGene25196, partial [Stylophora pistillata]
NIESVQELLTECEKIIKIEKERRSHMKELQKILDKRERRETVKRLTLEHTFRKQSIPLKIPTPPESQEDITELESEDDKEYLK